MEVLTTSFKHYSYTSSMNTEVPEEDITNTKIDQSQNWLTLHTPSLYDILRGAEISIRACTCRVCSIIYTTC